MEYTEGKWEAFKSNSGKWQVRCKHQYGFPLIAECFVDAETNAPLIASAPDLYEELKKALDEICRLCVRLNPQHENCTSCEDMEERREALAKAERG